MPLSVSAVYILRMLYSAGKIGNNYTNVRNLRHAFPKRMRDMTTVAYAVKELRKEGLIIIFKKGDCISLNPHEIHRIEKEIN
jgi:hypothetical protein